jgi:ferredoxin-NADP reductase
VLKPDGKGTPYLFDNVKKGSLVKCTTPLGKFTMPDTIDKDICFIATGTGIAPLRSMLIDIFNKNIPHRNIYMIFGNRKIGDILYRSEMETFEKEHPEFKFFPVLSRETKETWPEKFLGYVHPCLRGFIQGQPSGIILYLRLERYGKRSQGQAEGTRVYQE